MLSPVRLYFSSFGTITKTTGMRSAPAPAVSVSSRLAMLAAAGPIARTSAGRLLLMTSKIFLPRSASFFMSYSTTGIFETTEKPVRTSL